MLLSSSDNDDDKTIGRPRSPCSLIVGSRGKTPSIGMDKSEHMVSNEVGGPKMYDFIGGDEEERVGREKCDMLRMEPMICRRI